MKSRVFRVALIAFLLTIVGHPAALCQTLTVEHRTVPSGVHYTLIYQGAARADWMLSRPRKNDKSILLCVPAAFTDTLALFKSVHGLHVQHGHVLQRTPDQAIGGALKIEKGQCDILALPKGEMDDESLETLKQAGASLFQQFQVVKDGRAERFKDNSLFQRRGLGILKSGKRVIIESDRPLTLTQFGEDAVTLKATSLVYFDMGPWDEGWYRDPVSGDPVTMGQNRTMTDKQTNWFVFTVNDFRQVPKAHGL